MRPVILVTGNLRTFEQCADSFEALCHLLNPDIFLCISNRELDLHPYIVESHNYYRDSTLSLEVIQQKLRQAPVFASRIKKLIVLDREEEDIVVQTKYLPLFDTSKPWTGLDIFKQFHKINMGLEAIQAYEKEQGFMYDYVMKMRCDMILDIHSIPSTIQLKELFVGKDSSQESINDHIFICNNTNTLKSLPDGIVELFLKNDANRKVCESVHSMLAHICKQNGFQVKPVIGSTLNRNYTQLFDTTITLVTAFYDIGRSGWDNSRRSNDVYFRNCEKVLKQRYPLYIFTAEEFKDRCIEIRKRTDPTLLYTRIIIIPYHELKYYNQRERIHEIQQRTNTIRCNEPEYTKPDYIVVIYNKFQFLERVSTENPYSSQYFQWVDFGIHDNLLQVGCNQQIFHKTLYKPGRLRMRGFLPITTLTDRADFYSIKRETVAATLMGGDATTIKRITRLFEEEVERLFSMGFVNQEQYVYYWLMCQTPDLFDYSMIGHWNSLEESYFRHNSVRVAFCFSGHLRSYEHCKTNIAEKMIQPLKDMGLIVHSFLSSWDTTGYSNVDPMTLIKDEFIEYEFEKENNRWFHDTYNSNKWTTYSHLSGTTTCPNAVSMHYKMAKAYKMAKVYSEKQGFTYDIIVRIRPDATYVFNMNPNIIKESLVNSNTIYMPCHNGKYEVVTKFMSDHFFLGNISSMEKAMTAYDSIDVLLKEDCPHTCEGFLWKQLQLQNISIKRFMYGYGLVRKNNVYEPFI